MGKTVPYFNHVDDCIYRIGNQIHYGDDAFYVCDSDSQRGFRSLAIVNYTGLRVREAACLLGWLSFYDWSTTGSVFAFRNEKKNSVSYSSWMKDGYIPGEAIREADRLSHYRAMTVIAPLLPKLLVEHWWSEEYDCTIQSVRAVCFSYLHYSQEEMFYCDFGFGMLGTYLSDWYTRFKFSGNHFSPWFGPQRMAFYDTFYYGRRGNFPWICVDVRDGGETVGLWFKSCTRVVLRGHPSGLWCTYSLQGW